MKIPQIIAQSDHGFSVEFFPPKSEAAQQSLAKSVEVINSLNPSFYSITETGVSTTEESKTLTADTLKTVAGLCPDDFTLMPHFTCYGLTPPQVDKAVEVYNRLGTDNILALRGDNSTGDVPEGGFSHADALVSHLNSTAYSVGIAVYPESHPESLTIVQDRQDTLKKISAGADFAITQLFFDNRFHLDFREWLTSEGINIPIIPGILTDFGKLVKFCHLCGSSIPRPLFSEIAKWETKPEELNRFTIDFVAAQIKDLYDNGVKFFHLYSLNKWDNIAKINDKLNGLLSG